MQIQAIRRTAAMIVGAAALGGAALALGGCGKAREKTAEQIAEQSLRRAGVKDAAVDISDQQVTVKTKDGEMTAGTAGTVALPADFPADVFVEQEAAIRLAAKNPKGYVLHLETRQSPAAAADAYAAGMKAQGWTADSTLDMGGMRSLTFKKGNRQATVMVNTTPEGTQVMISVTESST